MRDRLPVLHYILRHSSDHSNDSIVLPSNASMHNITGLIPGTTYNLSLLASNSLGTGPGHVQVVTTMKGQAICMYVNVYSVTCNEIYTG